MIDKSTIAWPALSVAPAVYDADATGAAVDCKGFDAVTVVVSVGVGGVTFDETNTIGVLVEHSDDNDTFVAVPSMVGSSADDGVVVLLNAEHAAGTINAFGYMGGKRYVRASLAFDGTHETGTPVSVHIVREHPTYMPVLTYDA